MIAMFILGLLGIAVFHAIPAVVYLITWYTVIIGFFIVEERIERRD